MLLNERFKDIYCNFESRSSVKLIATTPRNKSAEPVSFEPNHLSERLYALSERPSRFIHDLCSLGGLLSFSLFPDVIPL